MSNERTEYTNGLREMADWLDQHPEVATPEGIFSCYSLNSTDEAAVLLRAMKPCKKEYHSDMFYLTRQFGAIKLRYVFDREAVCKRVVVAKRVVEAHLDPGYTVPAKLVEAHEEDVVEWRCGQALLDQPEVAAELEELAANDGASS